MPLGAVVGASLAVPASGSASAAWATPVLLSRVKAVAASAVEAARARRRAVARPRPAARLPPAAVAVRSRPAPRKRRRAAFVKRMRKLRVGDVWAAGNAAVRVVERSTGGGD